MHKIVASNSLKNKIENILNKILSKSWNQYIYIHVRLDIITRINKSPCRFQTQKYMTYLLPLLSYYVRRKFYRKVKCSRLLQLPYKRKYLYVQGRQIGKITKS